MIADSARGTRLGTLPPEPEGNKRTNVYMLDQALPEKKRFRIWRGAKTASDIFGAGAKGFISAAVAPPSC